MSPCPLENNTMLHIDLSSMTGDNDPNSIYSYRGSTSDRGASGGTTSSPDLWVLLAGILGGICFMLIIFGAVFVICRYHHVQKEKKRNRAEVERITAELKDTPAATDV